MFENIVIVIPSLEPTRVLNQYIDELVQEGFQHLVVINDGSSKEYDEIFQDIADQDECIVLIHEVNRGKGVALKTGYQYVKQHLPECIGIITADSDGQHAVEDVIKMANELAVSPHQLILGSRNFSLPCIPPKSRFGNRATSILFFCLYGKWLPDTQTGLRAFDKSLFDYMLEVKGERFEYEMQVLINCATDKVPMKKVEIRTIYEENNVGTHFQAFHDSMRIMKVVFGKFGKFLSVSLLSTLVDLSIAWLLMDLFQGYITYGLARVSAAVAIARLISMVVNYMMNKRFVFESKNRRTDSWAKYIILCLANIGLSSIFIFEVSVGFGINEKIAKVVGDCILFFMNYQVQRLWVFKKNQGGNVNVK